MTFESLNIIISRGKRTDNTSGATIKIILCVAYDIVNVNTYITVVILLYTVLFVTMYFRFNTCVTCNIFQVYFVALLQSSLLPPF